MKSVLDILESFNPEEKEQFKQILLTCIRCGHPKSKHRGRSGGCAHKVGFGNECECARYMGR